MTPAALMKESRFQYTTSDVTEAFRKALQDGVVTAWTRDDFDEELTDETLSHFALNVAHQVEKAVMQYLITDKAASIAHGLAVAERVRTKREAEEQDEGTK